MPWQVVLLTHAGSRHDHDGVRRQHKHGSGRERGCQSMCGWRLVALAAAADLTVRCGLVQRSMNLCSSLPSCPAALTGYA